jgi:hypothetical protein
MRGLDDYLTTDPREAEQARFELWAEKHKPELDWEDGAAVDSAWEEFEQELEDEYESHLEAQAEERAERDW